MTADFEAPHWTGDDERLSRPMHIVTAAADAQTPGDVLRRALRAHGECAVGDTFQATAAHGHRVACCWQMVNTRTGVLPLRQPDVPNPLEVIMPASPRNVPAPERGYETIDASEHLLKEMPIVRSIEQMRSLLRGHKAYVALGVADCAVPVSNEGVYSLQRLLAATGEAPVRATTIDNTVVVWPPGCYPLPAC